MLYPSLARAVAALYFAAALGTPAFSQAPSSGFPRSPDSRGAQALHEYEQMKEQTVSKKNSADPKLELELKRRLTEFAVSWNKLMQLSDRGVWNAKQARKTREAFEKLVKSKSWIESGH